jgi:Tol biopolymer transport system component
MPVSTASDNSHMPSRRIRIIARPLVWIILSYCALIGLGTTVHAQYYFGKNKVQYSRFDWQVMTTDHFRVYFYADESEVAKVAAHLAETAYRAAAINFSHEIKDKIPLIIYSAPAYFSQTNVIPGLLPESVGGFTEFIKGRVVVPFNGSYFDLDHVIRHELVHVFQLAKLDASISRMIVQRLAYPPLWLIEGQAEFWSEAWDTEADLILKDLVLSGRVPEITDLYQYEGSFFTYKLGQSICAFIDSTYGSDKLVRLYENWYKARSFEEIVKLTLGIDVKELSNQWHYSLKRRYFPEIEKRGLPSMEADRMVKSGYSMKGVPIIRQNHASDSSWLVYMAYRRGYAGLYMKPVEESMRDDMTLVKGERSAKFESLHLLHTGIDVDSSGRVLFSSKAKERDVLYMYDINKRRVVRAFQFEDLVAARSPRFSPDRMHAVFAGVRRSGYSDIYLLDLQTGKHSRLTDDIYYDADPAFTPDGRQVIFSSDRGAFGKTGALNLFARDNSTGAVVQLTFGQFRDQTPEPTSRGILFSSNRDSSINIFVLSDSGTLSRLTSYATGAYDPRVSLDGKELFFTGYQDQLFQMYRTKLTDSAIAYANTTDITAEPWNPDQISEAVSSASIAYDTRYSFDIAQSLVSYDAIYGSVGGIQAAISDMLGNKAYYFLLANTAETKDEVLSSFNGAVTFVNRERRLNWGVGVFHLYDEYYNDHDQYYFERQAGVAALLSYPLSKFQRLEFGSFARYDKKDLRYGQRAREEFLLSNSISWVYDNAIWDISGPIEGRRYNLSLSLTTSLSGSEITNRTGSIDIRHYFRLGQASAIANRLWAYSSAGDDPQRLYFGGSWSLRGFSRRAFFNRNILFASTELRFPLIDDLVINFPIGGFGFRGIRGALFYDNGAAWDDEFDQFYGSFGLGARVNLGYVVVLRFDFSRTTDYHTISKSTDFDFFFGWNF